MKNTFQASSGLPRDQKHIYINILPSTPSVARARGPRTARSRPYYVQTRTDCTHAWDSYQAAQRHAQKGQRRAAELYEDQPLIGGALAFAVGAAVAAALPRTQTEDDYLGEQSDAAVAEAERVFQEEKSKLTEVAKAAGEEAKKAAKDVKDTADSKASSKTAAKSAGKTVKKAGERVTKAAKDEAKKQDLGKPKT